MRLKIIVFPILILLVISCDFRSEHLALWTIGKNKKEFQKVYDHYNKPKDSLKLKAAKFLIENIDNHFYYYETKNEVETDDYFKNINIPIAIDSFDDPNLYWWLNEELVNINISKGIEDGSLSKPKYRLRTDLKNINAEFLIENIDYAFKAWDFPWSRGYSFDVFCKYILPYRYGNEPLESWRKDFYNKFEWIADSLSNSTTALEAASFVNKQFDYILAMPGELAEKNFSLKLSNQMDARMYRDCFDQSGLGVSILRSVGVPAAVVKIPLWGAASYGHETTGIFSLKNEWTTFDFGDSQGPIGERVAKAPKIFIKQFDKMNDFRPVLEDITGKLMNTVDLRVKVNVNETDEIYLCVFGDRKWFPLVKGENLKSEVIFKDVGNNREFMYLAAVKSKSKMKPVSPVFKSDSIGNLTYLEPILTKKNSATLERKNPGLAGGNRRLKLLINGEFSIANHNSFDDKKQLYKIDTILDYRNNIIKVPEQKGKYVRYDFPSSLESNFDGPAEISFYTTNQGKLEKIKGKYFGSPQLSQNHIKIMTDNDVLSYVEVWDQSKELNVETGKYILRKEKKPIWLAMEMDSITTVTHIGICPRNDKNGVYPGMNYELFYWDYAWISLGEKQATSHSISYDGIPENALLWLRNLDEGKEERIFILNEGKQIWY